MGWLNRLMGRQPQRMTAREYALGLAIATLQRAKALAEFLEAQGAARLGVFGESVFFQSALFLAFPHYVVMGTAFPEHAARLRQEFLTALIAAALGEEADKLSRQERTEMEREIVQTFEAYNNIWQTGSSGGELAERLGTAALERITGGRSASPNPRVGYTLFTEANNIFMKGSDLRGEVEITG